MTTKLKDIKLTKIALCEEGACSQSNIQFFKNKEGKEMGFEEILKTLTPENQELFKNHIAEVLKESKKEWAAENTKKAEKDEEDFEEEEEEEEEEVSKVGKEKKSAQERLVDDIERDDEKMKGSKKGSKKYNEGEGQVMRDEKKIKDDEDVEKMIKSAPPELRAILEKQQSQIVAAETLAKSLIEKETTNIAKSRAAILKSVPGSDEEKVDLFKSLSNLDSKIYDKVFEILEKANAVIETSSAFKSVGSDAEGIVGSSDETWAEIEKQAMPLAKSMNISKEKAISQVIENNPDLYKKYLSSLE